MQGWVFLSFPFLLSSWPHAPLSFSEVVCLHRSHHSCLTVLDPVELGVNKSAVSVHPRGPSLSLRAALPVPLCPECSVPPSAPCCPCTDRQPLLQVLPESLASGLSQRLSPLLPASVLYRPPAVGCLLGIKRRPLISVLNFTHVSFLPSCVTCDSGWL